MKRGNLQIIWDHRGDHIDFDVVRDGKRWADYNRTAEGLKFAADVRVTAERFGGFLRINADQRFRTAYPLKGDEQARLVDAFERQGYNVQQTGRMHPAPPEDIADWTAEAKPERRPMPTPSRGQGKRVSVNPPALAFGM